MLELKLKETEEDKKKVQINQIETEEENFKKSL